MRLLSLFLFLACATSKEEDYPPDTILACPAGGVAMTGSPDGAQLVEVLLCSPAGDCLSAPAWSWDPDGWIVVECHDIEDRDAVILWRWADAY